MGADLERLLKLAPPQDHDRLVDVTDQPGIVQLSGRHAGPFTEAIQLIDVHFLVFDPKDIGEAAFERQAAYQRKLPTFEVRAFPSASASALALGTTASRLTLPGGNTTPNSPAFFGCAWVGTQVV
jgi:hypothetical protein